MAVLVAVAACAAPAAPASAAPRALLTGDSMMYVIETRLGDDLARLGADVVRESRIGSGITKPFLFDWRTFAMEEERRYTPDVTIVFLGAGDIWPLKIRSRTVKCCGPEWRSAYTRRAERLVRTWLAGPGSRVYWLTLPRPRDPGLAAVHAKVNRAIARAVAAAGNRAAMIDLAAVLTPGWQYHRSLEWGGRRRIVRSSDGVHLAGAGPAVASALIGDRLVADGVLPGATGSG